MSWEIVHTGTLSATVCSADEENTGKLKNSTCGEYKEGQCKKYTPLLSFRRRHADPAAFRCPGEETGEGAGTGIGGVGTGAGGTTGREEGGTGPATAGGMPEEARETRPTARSRAFR